MRNIWVMAVVAVAAGCSGGIGSQTWDKNHDGLVSQCEGLDQFFCGITPGCEGQAVACIAICVDDGKGGCGSPCGDGFQCVPKPSQPSCALVPINSCASIPACEVQTVTSCEGSSGGGHTEARDLAAPPSVGCGGGCTSTQVCVNKQNSQSCEATAVDVCTSNPACELQSGPVCLIYCAPGAECPPCATPKQTCVTRTVVNSCENRSLATCTSDVGCMVESYACPAVCEDDGKGGCLPCPGQPSRCVPIPVVTSPPAGAPESK
jgi:hypothetical protein